MRGVAVRSTTIRGRIFVAFLGMSLLSGALGLYAVVAISHIGALINRTYDESLMSINYARASAADFAKMRSAFARRTHIRDAAVDGQARRRDRGTLDDAGRGSDDRGGALAIRPGGRARRAPCRRR